MFRDMWLWSSRENKKSRTREDRGQQFHAEVANSRTNISWSNLKLNSLRNPGGNTKGNPNFKQLAAMSHAMNAIGIEWV